jgi:hypothetical protein
MLGTYSYASGCEGIAQERKSGIIVDSRLIGARDI